MGESKQGRDGRKTPSPKDKTLVAGLPVSVIPNAITISGLALGVFSLYFIMAGDFRTVAIVIFACTIVDVFDGLAARVLNAQSRFGKELDSLSDFCCYGVVAAIAYYRYGLQETGWIGWLAVALYSSCAALRLARFNVQEPGAHSKGGNAGFNTGITAPGGATYLALPLLLQFAGYADFRDFPYWLAGYMALVGMLMISTLPTVSQRQLLAIYNSRYRPFFVAGVILLIILTVLYTWTLLCCFIAFQMVSTVVATWYSYAKVSPNS